MIRFLTRFWGSGLILALAVLLMSGKSEAGDQKKADGMDVKKWPSRDFDSLKDATRPICVYIHGAEDNGGGNSGSKNGKTGTKKVSNSQAKYYEGDKFLGDSTVKDKLKTFTCLCIPTEKPPAGWPEDWLSRAKGKCVLVLLSSDKKQMQIFDGSEPKKEDLIAAADRILKYEEAKKKAQEAPKVADNKPVQDKAAPKEDKIKLPGITEE